MLKIPAGQHQQPKFPNAASLEHCRLTVLAAARLVARKVQATIGRPDHPVHPCHAIRAKVHGDQHVRPGRPMMPARVLVVVFEVVVAAESRVVPQDVVDVPDPPACTLAVEHYKPPVRPLATVLFAPVQPSHLQFGHSAALLHPIRWQLLALRSSHEAVVLPLQVLALEARSNLPSKISIRKEYF